MFVLQIEHPIPSYESWKEAFDDDPIGRKESGVRRYRISRPVNDSDYVIVDLEFDTVAAAELALEALHQLWGRVQGHLMRDAQTRILAVAESKEY